jgi:hypothetical protein
MSTRRIGLHGSWIVALALVLTIVPETIAGGGRGGRGGGHAPRAPHISSGHHGGAGKPQAFKAPKMPHASAPSHTNGATAMQAHNNNGTNHTPASTAHRDAPSVGGANAVKTSHNRVGTANPTSAISPSRHLAATAGVGTGVNASRNTAGVAGSAGASGATSNPNGYTYGTGSWARNYRAYGYGHGYRNRYNGRGYAYGRSQGNNRAVVSRLRSVHATLARIDHDYQGHRLRAMHSISMAIRQLSHRSMIYRGSGFASGMNGGRNNLGMRRNNNLGANGRRGQPMSQAQSDARMGQALRALQGIHMQLANQGTNSTGHARARGHLLGAIRELNTALAIR